jgi:outer membrane lipoprotein SlyB
MKKIVIALSLALAMAVPAHAASVVRQHSAWVESANCVLVDRKESVSGGLVGGALGGVGGALVGSLFGKKGRTIGAIGGALGGAAYGSSGDKVYNCSVLASLNDGSKHLITKITNTQITTQDKIGVVELSDGTFQAL